jgi:amino acid adenylation domain-containing protein
MSEPRPDTALDGIAIVGMAGRFPGAPTLEAFWRNLRAGVESVSFFTAEELAAAGVPADRLADPDFVRAKATLEAADRFDAAFFGYLPAEVEMMDPQHRLFLECAWAALEDAGYDPLAAPGAVGVFGGMSQSTYLPLIRQVDPDGRKYFGYPLRLGTDKDYLTTRVSYKLNLRGPSMNVQTACSTSLVAVCQACQSLMAYQCDMALAGGVAVTVPLRGGHLFQEGGIFSPDGHCRPFDALARGTVSGDAVGLVVLKRLSEAMADGDTIHAVIRGFALNNDGSAKVGFTAPSPEGQAEVIAAAMALAGVGPDDISYVEAHGTGTPLGDPIEIAGLSSAHGSGEPGRCAVGSLKSNIGHTDTAAGVAGLIKTVLALKHRELPPSLHFTSPNPAIDLAATRFAVNDVLRPWTSDHAPRRAGVSAFGLGGTNAHVILEEAPPAGGRPPAGDWQVLPLAARTASALDAMAARLAARLRTADDVNLAEVAHTLQSGRRPFPCRRVVVCRTLAEAADRLEAGAGVRDVAAQAPGPVTFLFPGGGSQYPGMARDLHHAEPIFRTTLDDGLDRLQRAHGIDLRPWLFPDPANLSRAARELERPTPSILSVFLIEYALSRLWMSWGVEPAAMTGHSLGEYAAACVAGVMSLDDALAIVVARGRIFGRMEPGAMLGVLLPEAGVRPLLRGRISIAAINAPAAVVVSGPVDEIEAFARDLDARDVETQRIRIAVAAHSAMIDPFLDEFARVVSGVRLSPPAVPFISNLTGRWITDAEATDSTYWVRHLREPVRFADGLATLLAEPARILLEVGPGRTLSTLARQQPVQPRAILTSIRHPTEQTADVPFILASLGTLWAAGASVDWRALHGTPAPRRVSLPAYPFEGDRYWPSSEAVAADGPSAHVATLTTHAEPAPAGDSSMANAPDRTDRILDEMARLLQALSGKPLTAADRGRSFIELGFDSLFLGQASLAFQRAFGVKLRFRDFLEAAPTPVAMAALLDGRMAPDRMAAPVAAPVPVPMAVPTPAVTMAASPALLDPAGLSVGADAGVIERVVAQQLRVVLEVTRQQLAALGRPAAPAAATLPAPEVATAAPAVARDSLAPIKVFAQAIVNDPSGIEWAPVASGPGRDLTAQQAAALASLVADYGRKTARSKAMTEEMRPYLADPRAIVGFAPLWKETVYQIVSERSLGGRLWDVDGNEWIDVTLGFGASAYGHSPDFVVEAVRAQLEKGMELGTQSEVAAQTAKLFCEITGHERVCFCTAGTEAVMGAMRLARAHTGRDRVAMFVGDTHGRLDEVLGRPVVADGGYSALPAAVGIAPHAVKPTLFLEYGNPKSLEIIERYADELAAVLVEPVRTRSPDLQPFAFLRELRELARARGITFIMDEVVTGFRVHQGGAQRLLGIDPDLSTWGKAVAAGMPIGVISGKAEFMDALDGGAWHYGDDSVPEARMTNFGGAGTFARHPLGMAAALATLQHVKAEGPALQDRTAARTERLVTTLNAAFRERGLPIHLEWFRTFFVPRVLGDRRFEPLFFVALRHEGIHAYVDYPCFICTAHTEADIDALIAGFMRAADRMARGGFLSRPAGAPGPDEPPAEIAALPLTAGQTEIWLASRQGEDAAAAFNQSVSIDLRGPLDIEALRRAVARVVGRHDALRTTVAADGASQVVHPSIAIEVPVVDLAATGPVTDAAVTAFLRDDAARPFDLVAGPLVRVSVLACAPDRHRVVVTVFHLVCDGWSLGMVVRDMAVLYSADVEGRAADLPPAMPFADYLAWRAQPDQADDERRSAEYWTAMYADRVPVLDLPVAGSRPIAKTYHAARQGFRLDARATAGLRRAASQHGCTLFAVSLAAFALLLHRLSGQDDVVVGLAAAGQAAVGDDNLIGHCVSLLPWRSRIGPGDTVRGYLGATKSALMDAYDHQGCSYGDVLGRLTMERDPGRLPLVSAIMTHETETAGVQFSGLSHRVLANPAPCCNFELELYLMESAEGVELTLVHNRDLFDEATASRWIGHLEHLLAALAGPCDPALPIGQLPMIGPADRQRILEDWNQTAAGPALPGHTLADLFEAQAARTPGAVAVVDGLTRLTYADVDRRASQIARSLRDAGAAPDALVGVMVERSADLVIAILGILKAGAAYVPLDPAYPADRLAAIVADARATLIVTRETLLDRLPSFTGATLCLDRDRDRVMRQSSDRIERSASSTNLAYVLFTSGSTGRPKGVAIEHRSIVTFVNWARGVFPPEDLAGVLFATSICFDLSAFELFVPLSTGGTVVVAGSVLDLPALPARDEVTLINTVPSAMAELVRARGVPASVTTVNLAGEALPAALVEAIYASTSTRAIYNLYGPTETTTYSTFAEVPRGAPVTIGRPILNTRVYVLDRDGGPVPAGVAGELYIGGAGLARGYYGRPDLTAERFVPDPFAARAGARMYRTGDLCRWRQDGTLEYLGRLDRQVKVRGFRIELAEIESVLARQPGVRACVVVAEGGATLVAYVESDEHPAAAVDAWRRAVRQALPDYMVPSAFRVVDRFPLTPNGKLDVKALPRAAGSSAVPETRENSAALDAPRSDLERTLTAIWTSVLKIDRVGLHDDFFAVGGHSLLAAQVVSRIYDACGVQLSLRTMFDASTIASLAGVLEKRPGGLAGAGAAAGAAPRREVLDL